MSVAPHTLDHEVGLWDTNGVLLASVVVTSADPPIDSFRYYRGTGLHVPAGATTVKWVGANILLGSAVPEPATWAMMIIGFGAVGGALRASRRRGAVEAI